MRRAIVNRLLAAGKSDPKGFEAGEQLGRKWAEEVATPRLLKLVSQMQKEDTEEGEDQGPLADDLVWMIADKETWKETVAYVRDLGNEYHPLLGDKMDEFARGFISGADDARMEYEVTRITGMEGEVRRGAEEDAEEDLQGMGLNITAGLAKTVMDAGATWAKETAPAEEQFMGGLSEEQKKDFFGRCFLSGVRSVQEEVKAAS